jgi:hypothetical protein
MQGEEMTPEQILALGSGGLGVAFLWVITNFLLKWQRQKGSCDAKGSGPRCVEDQAVKAALISQALTADHMKRTQNNTERLLEKMTEQNVSIKAMAAESEKHTRYLKQIASNSNSNRL